MATKALVSRSYSLTTSLNVFRPIRSTRQTFSACGQCFSTVYASGACGLISKGRFNAETRYPLRFSPIKQPWRRKYLLKASQQLRTASSKPEDQKAGLDAKNNLPSPPSSASEKAPVTILSRLRPLPHENIYTIPNILTFTRLAAAPLVGYSILTSQPLLALSLFAYAGVTDFVDGYLARRLQQTTVVGTVIDPMADKALMTISVVCLAVTGAIPVWLVVIVLGRDVALAISAIYFRWISLPPPKTMARYWDFSLPSAEVRPTEISKINTLLQLLFIGGAMTLPVLPEALVAAGNLDGIMEGFQYLVAGTTIWSGASYIYSKDAVKILTKEEIKERTEKEM